MKMKHIMAVAALTLLAGQQVQAGPGSVSKLSPSLTLTEEDYLGEGSKGDNYFEKQRLVTQKIGTKQILEMLYDNEDIDGIRGWWIVVETYYDEEAGESGTGRIYATNKAGDRVILDDSQDFDTYILDLDTSIDDYDDDTVGVESYNYKSNESKGTESNKFTEVRAATLTVVIDGNYAELNGSFTFNSAYKSKSNEEIQFREINQTYLRGGSMSESSAPGYDWDWLYYEDGDEYYSTNSIIAGSLKIGKSEAITFS